MDAAWFGFLGVIVGGFISSIWSWLAIVRQEQTDAVVAARLVDDDLELVSTGDATPSPTLWVDHRVALAKVLGKDQWRTVSDVYNGGYTAPSAEAVVQARAWLSHLVAGKRHIVPYRWRPKLNLFARAKSRS